MPMPHRRARRASAEHTPAGDSANAQLPLGQSRVQNRYSGRPRISGLHPGGGSRRGRAHYTPIERVAVIMPTYEERQNLEAIAGRLRAAVPHADLLVVDDNSPDGTGDLADKMSEADWQIQVLHRTEKAGLGPAYIAGFRWAM